MDLYFMLCKYHRFNSPCRPVIEQRERVITFFQHGDPTEYGHHTGSKFIEMVDAQLFLKFLCIGFVGTYLTIEFYELRQTQFPLSVLFMQKPKSGHQSFILIDERVADDRFDTGRLLKMCGEIIRNLLRKNVWSLQIKQGHTVEEGINHTFMLSHEQQLSPGMQVGRFVKSGNPSGIIGNTDFHDTRECLSGALVHQRIHIAAHHLPIDIHVLGGSLLGGDGFGNERVTDNLNSGIPFQFLHTLLFHASHDNHRISALDDITLIESQFRKFFCDETVMDNPWLQFAMWGDDDTYPQMDGLTDHPRGTRPPASVKVENIRTVMFELFAHLRQAGCGDNYGIIATDAADKKTDELSCVGIILGVYMQNFNHLSLYNPLFYTTFCRHLRMKSYLSACAWRIRCQTCCQTIRHSIHGMSMAGMDSPNLRAV